MLEVKKNYLIHTTATPKKAVQLLNNGKINNLPLLTNQTDELYAGAAQLLLTQNITTFSFGYIDSNRALVVYKDPNDGNKGKCFVMYANQNYVSIPMTYTFETNAVKSIVTVNTGYDYVPILWIREGGGLYSCVANMNGGASGSISTAQLIDSSAQDYLSICYLSSGKFAFAWKNTIGGQICAATLTSTNITFGSNVNFTNNDIKDISLGYNTTDKLVCVYSDNINGGKGYGFVATVSTTTISVYPPVSFSGIDTCRQIHIENINTTYMAIVYKDGSDNGKLLIITVSGNSFTAGTAIQFGTGAINFPVVRYNNSRLNIIYIDVADGKKGKVEVYINSGTTLTKKSTTTFEFEPISNLDALYVSYNSADKIIVMYITPNDTGYLHLRTLMPMEGKRLGILQDDGNVLLLGLSKGHSNLKPGVISYIDTNGTVQNYPYSTHTQIGINKSATEIIIDKYIVS